MNVVQTTINTIVVLIVYQIVVIAQFDLNADLVQPRFAMEEVELDEIPHPVEYTCVCVLFVLFLFIFFIFLVILVIIGVILL